MNAITDIFAFAAAHADYWTEFLSGADYSSILSDDEVRALEAARVHVEDGIYDLLNTCGASLADKLSGHGVVSRNFQRGATTKNRRVRVDPPEEWRNRLYGLEFEFAPDDTNQHILLYGSLVVKKGSGDVLAQRIRKNGKEFKYEGYYIYGEGVSLTRDEQVTAVAKRAADSLGDLFLAAQ